MDEPRLQQLLADVRSGACSPDEAVHLLRRLPFADLGFAKVDHHRSLRQGLPEAVYGQGKTSQQCLTIVGELLGHGHGHGHGQGHGLAHAHGHGHGHGHTAPDHTSTDSQPDGPSSPAIPDPGGPVILTRADAAQVELVKSGYPGGVRTLTGSATGGDQIRGELSTVVWRPAPPRPVRTLVVTAGTSDLPVARECEATLTALGLRPVLLPDCGVAGVHRLLASADELADADAVVVVAGMEGALASLIGGITPAPVVAVPTSTGYGAALEGVTALLAMHASCAAGITVVGIDNGFGAACAIARILP